jgi:muconolactone D-isomerase
VADWVDLSESAGPGGIEVLFLSKLRIDQKDLSLDEFWDLWEVAARTAQETIKAGGAVEALYKVAGQRRVIVINNVDSHEDLDRILMASPLAQYITVEDCLPLRSYDGFAEDVRRRWSVLPEGVYDPRNES